MENEMEYQNNGYGLFVIIFVIFLVLKLTNQIDWSWWWVTSPLWIPLVIVMSISVIVFMSIMICSLFGYNIEPKILKLQEKLKNIK